MHQDDEPERQALLSRALEAARTAGAAYADARYLIVTDEGWGWRGATGFPVPSNSIRHSVNVRALVKGYWGYAALNVSGITPDDAAKLGREAVAQAKTGAKGPPRTVELAPVPVVRNGSWVTPIKIDPLTVSFAEKIDTINGLSRFLAAQPFGAVTQPNMSFERANQWFASTEGSAFTQTLYRTQLYFPVRLGPHWRTRKSGARSTDSFVSASGAGWEYVLDAPIEREGERLMRQANDARFAVPIDVGRYEVVFDGAATAKLVDAHIGEATTLDRAMGYRANDEGTSYLNDPLAMLGTFQIGSPLLNVTANRSMAGGSATVKWDDEGVEPDEAPLVKDGILTDFQTTRESASWLAPYYQKIGKPVRSHGGLAAPFGRIPAQSAHNLVMSSSSADTSFETLCSGIANGYAVLSGSYRADQQALNADGTGDLVYEIKNGKLGRVVTGGVILTRATDLWKNLTAVGGNSTVSSLTPRGFGPAHTIAAPAARFKQVAVTSDPVRAGWSTLLL